MAEKLRRRLRARSLDLATSAAAHLPHAFVRGALTSLTPLALPSRAHAITLENLARVLGTETSERERRAIARGVLRHSARLLAEWIRLAGGSGERQGAWIEREVELDASVSILRAEVSRGRGAIVVTAHIGNWELLAARLRRAGFDGCVLGFERPGDPSHRWLARMRRAYDVTTLTQEASARDVLHVLRRGGVVGILPDLEARRLDGVFVPFFDRLALTMTLPAALSRAAGVPLVPARCTLEGGRYVLRFDEPLELEHDLGRADAQRDLLTRMNRLFEGWIRAAPEQWAWHQSRWRSDPASFEPLPYAERRRRARARAH